MERIVNQSLLVSSFKGFKTPESDVPLWQKLQDIAQGKFLRAVSNLRLLIRQDQPEEAARIKRQLPGFTLSATYVQRRVAEGVTGYNDLVMLDFDKLPEEELLRCRDLICRESHTIFCFRSPSGNGLKVGVHLRSEKTDRLRSVFLARPEISVGELERYHRQVFELTLKHYEACCGVKIDSSGSDMGRLCFMSYDPEIYINREALEVFEPLRPRIVTTRSAVQADAQPANPSDAQAEDAQAEDAPAEDAPAPAKRINRQKIIRAELPADGTVDVSGIDPHIQMEFQGCINYVNRNYAYEPGGRDNYIYKLGHTCYTRKLPQEQATLLAQQKFGGSPDIDVVRTMANAYNYVNRTDEREEDARKPISIRVFEALKTLYEVRRNVVLESLEYRKLGTEPWSPLRKEDYNTIFLDVSEVGIRCQAPLVRTVVNSRFARNFNPFEEYFYSLPPWDGRTDHIGRLAETMQTNHQVFWHDCFKRWIVGLVACALDNEKENQLALIIKGQQGKGKSTWIRHLLPPELKCYYRNGMLKPGEKDHMLMLSKRLIINLEEFEGMKAGEIAELKRLIAQDSIVERPAYAEETGFYVRRASFIASTNEPRFLEDITGTRRFPTVTAEEIDYRTPVNHAGVYAQALHLWRDGFKYWYDEEEFQVLNAHNMQYVIASQEEELFYHYFHKPEPRDLDKKWMPVSAILTKLAFYGKLLPNRQQQRTLIRVLERDGFAKRITANRIVEYEVVFDVSEKG